MVISQRTKIILHKCFPQTFFKLLWQSFDIKLECLLGSKTGIC